MSRIKTPHTCGCLVCPLTSVLPPNESQAASSENLCWSFQLYNRITDCGSSSAFWKRFVADIVVPIIPRCHELHNNKMRTFVASPRPVSVYGFSEPLAGTSKDPCHQSSGATLYAIQYIQGQKKASWNMFCSIILFLYVSRIVSTGSLCSGVLLVCFSRLSSSLASRDCPGLQMSRPPCSNFQGSLLGF